MQRLRRLALLASAAAALAAAGCNMAVPALYVMQGPGKKPAVYTLPEDRKLVVYVDDRRNVVSRLQLRAQLADDIGTMLRSEELVREVVSGRELIAYVRRVETSTKRVSIEELGAAYAQIAFHPALDSEELKAAVGHLSYRARRILLSALAWVAAAGDPARIAGTYAALNLAVWAALASAASPTAW